MRGVGAGDTAGAVVFVFVVVVVAAAGVVVLVFVGVGTVMLFVLRQSRGEYGQFLSSGAPQNVIPL